MPRARGDWKSLGCQIRAVIQYIYSIVQEHADEVGLPARDINGQDSELAYLRLPIKSCMGG